MLKINIGNHPARHTPTKSPNPPADLKAHIELTENFSMLKRRRYQKAIQRRCKTKIPQGAVKINTFTQKRLQQPPPPS